MQKRVCYIVGAAEIDGLYFSPKKDDLVIAADGGYAHLTNANIKADIVVGDFDSLDKPPTHPCVIRLKAEKDETDLYEAALIGLNKGYKDFVIYGGTGGRLDHTIANIQLLNMLANRQCRGVLIGNGQNLTVIKNSVLNFHPNHKGKISVFSLVETSLGVTLKGLKYPLNDYNMDNRFPIGVSNEFIGEKASISVREGELLIIYDV